ncbi:hypothetical protein OF83DRAFT_1172202 [Amylostereum chailletii]|nr:hypothetical protein OF83DRAFT_1172202 [Amylostereum chailletii]
MTRNLAEISLNVPSGTPYLPYKFLRVADASKGRIAYPVPERPRASLTTLPDDVLLLIIGLVGVEDILALRMTSKRFSSVTRLRWVWSEALKHHVIDRKIPVPAFIADLKSLSARELEARALHATTFQRNWCAPEPRPRRALDFRVNIELDGSQTYGLLETEPAPVSHVMFPPGYNGELLITVSEHKRVVCWEVPLGGSQAFVVAERSLSHAKISAIVVNEDPKSEAILVVVWSRMNTDQPTPSNTPREIVVEAWSMDRFHGCFNVIRSDVLPANMHGRMLPLTRLMGHLAFMGDPVALWDWRQRGTYLMLNNATAHVSPVPDSLLAVKLIRGYLLIVRQSHIQLLPLPEYDDVGKPLRRGPIAGAALLHLHEVAREAVIVTHELTEEEKAAWQFEPVTILMRVADGGFHTIRKYNIFPQPVASTSATTSSPAVQMVPNTMQLAPRLLPSGATLVPTLPCYFPVNPVTTIPVPPSCANLTLGRNGKGFWTETRNITTGHATYPARCLVGFDVVSRVVFRDGTPVWENEFVVREGVLHASRMGIGEVAQKKYRLMSAALEDTVGRVAIGGRDGRMQVLDFA